MRKVCRLVCCVVALALVLLIVGGCNTWAGVGKDVQRSGEAIEGSAD